MSRSKGLLGFCRRHRPPGSVSPVVQFQLVQRAAAIKEAGAAAITAIVRDTDETVILIVPPVLRVGILFSIVSSKHHAEIGGRTIPIGAGCWIGCTESVQNLEVTVRPDAVNDTVSIHPPE